MFYGSFVNRRRESEEGSQLSQHGTEIYELCERKSYIISGASRTSENEDNSGDLPHSISSLNGLLSRFGECSLGDLPIKA